MIATLSGSSVSSRIFNQICCIKVILTWHICIYELFFVSCSKPGISALEKCLLECVVTNNSRAVNLSSTPHPIFCRGGKFQLENCEYDSQLQWSIIDLSYNRIVIFIVIYDNLAFAETASMISHIFRIMSSFSISKMPFFPPRSRIYIIHHLPNMWSALITI